MIDQWLVWPGEVDNSTCDKIIEQGLKLKSDVGIVGDDSTARADISVRSSIVGWFNDYEVPWITNIISNYINQANRKNFGFDISYGIQGVQFSSYTAVKSGRYDWHVDTFHSSTAPSDRKLSFCIQLSDPSTYEGGEFEFRGCDPLDNDLFKPKGSILIFPSIFEHRVLPVTKGVRYSLVSWIEGPKWK